AFRSVHGIWVFNLSEDLPLRPSFSHFIVKRFRVFRAPLQSTLQRYARALDARLRLVLEVPTLREVPTWHRLSSYRGSARDHQVRVGADKEILMQTNWARHISVRQVEVA
ncbi:hypothetical protein ABLN79_07080, partial [Mycobacterium tuberculosis]